MSPLCCAGLLDDALGLPSNADDLQPVNVGGAAQSAQESSDESHEESDNSYDSQATNPWNAGESERMCDFDHHDHALANAPHHTI